MEKKKVIINDEETPSVSVLPVRNATEEAAKVIEEIKTPIIKEVVPVPVIKEVAPAKPVIEKTTETAKETVIVSDEKPAKKFKLKKSKTETPAVAELAIEGETAVKPKTSLLKKLLWPFTTKKGIATTLCVGLAAVLAVFGGKISPKQTAYQLALENIAESRFYLKQHTTGDYNIQFSSGMREEPYEKNGAAEQTTPFTLISVNPTTNLLRDCTTIEASLKIGDAEPQTITLEKNAYPPYNFAYDLASLTDISEPVSIMLSVAGAQEVALENVMSGEGAITWEKALETASEVLADSIKDTQGFECYVKIVCDRSTANSAFWSVQVINKDLSSHYVIMDKTGKVINKK
ncbi:MAG: hypothetical protein LBM01_00285 [Christensenellaceae bacterium]|jgi:hypothetical protein|nr:hypothetical protein [Christensenellaceae bacterium]